MLSMKHEGLCEGQALDGRCTGNAEEERNFAKVRPWVERTEQLVCQAMIDLNASLCYKEYTVASLPLVDDIVFRTENASCEVLEKRG
jgi:hypothetical protein